MPYPFLSDAWLDEVKAIRSRYAGQGASVPHRIKMNQVITNVPFGEGELTLHMDTSSGEVVMDKGHLNDAEVTVTTDYDTAKALFVDQNPHTAMHAFMAGKIKIQGDMTKLLAMQTSPSDETAKKIAEEIKSITI